MRCVRHILAYILVLALIICDNEVALCKNIDGNTFPDIYVQNMKLEMKSTPVKYFNNELYVPAREVFEALGAEVVWNQDSCTTDIRFHSYSIKMDGNSHTMSTYIDKNNTDDEGCVVYMGNYNYVKLSSLENILDINYDRLNTNNKISIRDYVPVSIEYKGKTYSKTDSEPVELNSGKVVGYTKNGLKIVKVNRYILWIIPIGYKIYVQTLNEDEYINFTK